MTVATPPPVIDDGPASGSEPEEPLAPMTRAARIVNALPEAVVVVVALILNTWALAQNGYGNLYYAATVRSMGDSVTNFAYGVYDPGGWITTDKPPLPYWIDTIVTKVFGYSSWTLLLPSAIFGAIAVGLLIATLRPVWGRTAGIVGGAALAVTPAMVAVSRSNNPDALLVLLCVAAAWATTHALRKGATRWLLAAASFVALAFLTKLLAGFLVLPGLWLAYLVAGPSPWKRRIVQLVGATTVVAFVTVGWVAAMDLTRPAGQPYVGSSADGSARDLVLGYNGIGRILGQGGPGGGGGGGAVPFGPGMIVGNNGIDQFGGTPGLTRLFNNGMGDQIMWLLPVAAIAGVAGIALAVRHRRRDAQLGTTIVFLGWLLVTAAVFSTAKGIFHNYYVSMLAPAVAGLVGVGVALVRANGRIGRFVAAGTLLATAALQVVLLDRVDAWSWLRTAVPIGLGIAALALVVSATPALRRHSAAVAFGALALAFVASAAAPTAWSLGAVQRPASGTFPDARPVDAGGIGSAAMPFGVGGPGGGPGGGGSGPFGGIDEKELAWLRQQPGTGRWLLAVGSSMEASNAIIDGDSVMAMGGFTGSDPAMTKERLADLVDRGELRFVSVGGLSLGGANAVTGIVSQVCTAVPASSWGGAGTSGLYDCQGKGTDIRNAADTPATSGLPGVPGGGGGSAGGFPGGGFPGGGAPQGDTPQAGFPGGVPGAGAPGGGLPAGIPSNITPEQLRFGQCVIQHGGNLQDLLALASGQGGTPSAETQSAIDQCGGLPATSP